MEVLGQSPFGRLANYFIPGVAHPDELRGTLQPKYLGNPYSVEFRQWVDGNRGVPIANNYFELAIQAVDDANVALLDCKVNCSPFDPGPGIAIHHPSGGPIHGFHLAVSLDDESVQCFPGREIPYPPEPIPLRFNIEPHKTENFVVHAHSTRSPVTWTLELDFLVNGNRVVKHVTKPDGDNFATVPFEFCRITETFYYWDGRGWDSQG